MLVLTRKPEEKIVISIGNQEQIVITILRIQGGKVSLGIEADKKWEILREELKLAKEEIRELEESLVDA